MTEGFPIIMANRKHWKPHYDQDYFINRSGFPIVCYDYIRRMCNFDQHMFDIAHTQFFSGDSNNVQMGIVLMNFAREMGSPQASVLWKDWEQKGFPRTHLECQEWMPDYVNHRRSTRRGIIYPGAKTNHYEVKLLNTQQYSWKEFKILSKYERIDLLEHAYSCPLTGRQFIWLQEVYKHPEAIRLWRQLEELQAQRRMWRRRCFIAFIGCTRRILPKDIIKMILLQFIGPKHWDNLL